MNETQLHPEDLLDRDAQGSATPATASHLELHAQQCEVCALQRQMAADRRLEADDAWTRSDSVAWQSQIHRAMRQPSSLRMRKLRLFVGGGIGLLATTAFAAGLTVSYQRLRNQTPAVVLAVTPLPSAQPPQFTLSETHTEEVQMPRILDPEQVQAKPSQAKPRPILDAGTLFRRANGARVAGRITEATQFYQALTQQHPQTQEARVAHVSLGRLYLDRLRSPDKALPHFDSYLAAVPHGPLGEEALLGRALSLRAMGREIDSQQSWIRLLAEYPDSFHAPEAKKQLGISP